MPTALPDNRAKPLPDGLILRAPRPADAESMNALINLPGAFSGTLGIPFRSLAETVAFLENDDPDRTQIVAVLGDIVVGEASFSRFRRRRAHAAAIAIAVHDDYVGMGVGSALIGALVVSADNWLQIKRLELTVYADNVRAIRLYEKFGFEREGVLRDYAFRDGQFVDALYMARVRR